MYIRSYIKEHENVFVFFVRKAILVPLASALCCLHHLFSMA